MMFPCSVNNVSFDGCVVVPPLIVPSLDLRLPPIIPTTSANAVVVTISVATIIPSIESTVPFRTHVTHSIFISVFNTSTSMSHSQGSITKGVRLESVGNIK